MLVNIKTLVAALLAEEALPPEAGDEDIRRAFAEAEAERLKRVAGAENAENARFNRERLDKLRERRILWERGS